MAGIFLFAFCNIAMVVINEKRGLKEKIKIAEQHHFLPKPYPMSRDSHTSPDIVFFQCNSEYPPHSWDVFFLPVGDLSVNETPSNYHGPLLIETSLLVHWSSVSCLWMLLGKQAIKAVPSENCNITCVITVLMMLPSDGGNFKYVSLETWHILNNFNTISCWTCSSSLRCIYQIEILVIFRLI